MSNVEVLHIPTSTSAEELRGLFADHGRVTHLLLSFEAGAAEGTAFVSFADPQAASEAVDLLDSYPLGTSLLEVQPITTDRFVAALAGRLLAAAAAAAAGGKQAAAEGTRWQQAQRMPQTLSAESSQTATADYDDNDGGGGGVGWHMPAPAGTVAGGPGIGGAVSSLGEGSGSGGGGISALEEEMRELQLHLQQHADDFQQLAAVHPQQQQQPDWKQEQQYGDDYGVHEDADDSGWHDVRGPSSSSSSSSARHKTLGGTPKAGVAASSGGGGGSGGEAGANTGLWIGWIDNSVEKADLARALSRFGPMHIEHLQAATQLAYDGQRYKWGIARYQRLEDSIRAKKATDKQVLPGISVIPLKVTYYQPQHRSAAARDAGY